MAAFERKKKDIPIPIPVPSGSSAESVCGVAFTTLSHKTARKKPFR